jgi:hypothetical protein
MWRALEELPTGISVAADWQHYVGDAWPAFQAGFLDRCSEPATSYYCPQECGCAHRVVHHDDGRIVAACECDPWNCDTFELTAADVVDWEFNRTRLARAVCRAFELERREQDLGLPWTQQIARFSATAVPVVLTIQQDPYEFENVVARLAARWHDGFILFTPTSRFVDGRVHELLSHARAKFFDLESNLDLTPWGELKARRRAGELFAALVPKEVAATSDNEAQRLFALIEALETETNYRKAPVTRVFLLYCARGLSREEVAKRCRCVPSLVTLRLKAIEAKLGRKAAELRLISGHFERIAESLTDDRARQVHRASALDQPEEEQWGQ